MAPSTMVCCLDVGKQDSHNSRKGEWLLMLHPRHPSRPTPPAWAVEALQRRCLTG